MKDYATSDITVAPFPSNSGTSLTVNTGHGTRFPDAPFKVSVYPVGAMPTLDNAEKLLVTAKDGDNFTIVRAQGDTTPKFIQKDWIISNSLFVEDVGKSAYNLWLDAGNTGTEADYFLSLKGDTGDTGPIGPVSTVPGPTGPASTVPGPAGKRVEINNSGTYIQYRYEGDSTWIDLVALATLKGDTGTAGTDGTNGSDGLEVELQVSGGYVQWRYVGGSWTNLIAVSTLIGATGSPGTNGTNGTNGNTWYSGTAAPSTLYVDGDFYLRTTTGDVYKQTAGSWGSPIENITGPAGPAGSGTGDMLASIYDPTGVYASAFSQDNMLDGTTNKNYTATEKTKLAAISGANTGDQVLPTGGTPAIVLGTANTPGSSPNFLRRDDTILAFDATALTAEAIGSTSSVGTASTAARRDHRHAMPTALAMLSGIGGGYAACATAIGTVAKTVALTGYTLVVGGTVGVTFTNGNSAASPTLNINSAGAKPLFVNGAAVTTIPAGFTCLLMYDGTNYNIVDDGLGTTVPTTQAFGDAAVAGTSIEMAHVDHKHAMPATPTKTTVGLGNVDNTADTAKPVSTSQQTALDLKADATGWTPFSNGTYSAGAILYAPGVITGILVTGMRIKVTDVTVKYFVITGISTDGSSNNILTLSGQGGATLSGGAITNTFYSRALAPTGVNFSIGEAPWTAWAPAITANSGTFTSVSASGKYTTIGKTVLWKLDITITTNGTASGTQFAVPVTAKDSSGNIGAGREDAIVGASFNVRLLSASTAVVAKYDNNPLNGNGYVLRCSGAYEMA